MMWFDVALAASVLFSAPSGVSVKENCRVTNGRLSCSIKGNRARRHQVSSRGRRAFSQRIRSSRNEIHRDETRPLSIGKPWRGRLRNAERLAPKGPGYVVAPRTLMRRRNYGLSELVRLVRFVATYVSERHPGAVMVVGDMSARHGGRITGHRSHQSGRDVDIGFFLVDERLSPVALLDTFVRVDRLGRSLDPHPGLRFDIERNWAVVEALIVNPVVEVRLVFVSREVRDMLLKYARAIGVPPEIYRKAEEILHYFPNHADHFHVRIGCPKDQPMCIP